MKKALVFALALVLAAGLLGGCAGKLPAPDASESVAASRSSTPASTRPSGSAAPESTPESLPESEAPSDPASTIPDGAHRIGDWVSSYFFDFKVISAQKVDSFGGYEPSAGYTLLDIVIETKNTFGSEFVMIDTDYEVWWGSDDNDDALAYTLLELDGAVEEYVDLPAGASMTEHYIYEVPEHETDFKLLYLEIFDTDIESERYGDAHFVYFSA